MADDPSPRHGYDPDDLTAWRKAQPPSSSDRLDGLVEAWLRADGDPRAQPDRCPALHEEDGIVGPRCILSADHEGGHAYTLSGDA